MEKKGRGPHPTEVVTTELQQKVLEEIANGQQMAHVYVTRAQLILEAKKGKRNTRIAREQQCNRGTVQRWRDRWAANQKVLAEREADLAKSGYRNLVLEVLSDEERSGCPATFTPEQLCQIIAVAVQPPKEYGCPVTHWTPRELAHVVVREKIVDSISTRHIGRFLKDVRPETA